MLDVCFLIRRIIENWRYGMGMPLSEGAFDTVGDLGTARADEC